MKSNSFLKNRKALTALLLCTGFVATQPFSVMAEEIVTAVQTVQQQKQSVSGTIKDPVGEPVIGASILEKGTTNGTITDFDGNFTLNVAPGATLVISYIGYKNQEMKVIPGKSLNIILQEDTETLEEVVVVGYGVQKKSDVTGSVTSVGKERQEKRIRDRKLYYGKLMPFIYARFFGLLGLFRVILARTISLFRPMMLEVSECDMRVTVNKSCALAAQTFMIAMANEGYDTCPLEGFDSRRMKKLLKLPHGAGINMVIPCGIRDGNKGIWGERGRVPFDEIYHRI